MDHLWIGGVTANDVSGTVGLGYIFLTGVRTVAKTNVGSGEITGDYGHLPCQAAMVYDPDVWDCPVTTGPPVGRG